MTPPTGTGDVELDPGRGMAWVDEHGAHLVDYASFHLEPSRVLGAAGAALEACAVQAKPGNVADRAWLLSALRRECGPGAVRGDGFRPGPGPGVPDDRAVRRAWSLVDPVGAETLRLLYRHELQLRDLAYVQALAVKEAARLVARTQDMVEILVSGLDGLARGRPLCPEIAALAGAVFPEGGPADFGAPRTALLTHIVTCVVCKRPINIRYTVPQILSRPPLAPLTSDARRRLVEAVTVAAPPAGASAHRPPTSFGLPLAAPVATDHDLPAPSARPPAAPAGTPAGPARPPVSAAQSPAPAGLVPGQVPSTPAGPVPGQVPPAAAAGPASPAVPPQTRRHPHAPLDRRRHPHAPVEPRPQRPETRPGAAPGGPALPRTDAPAGPVIPGPVTRGSVARDPAAPGPVTGGSATRGPVARGGGDEQRSAAQDTPLYDALLSQIQAREAARARSAVPSGAEQDDVPEDLLADAVEGRVAGAQVRIVRVLTRVGSLVRATALRIVIVVVAGAAGTVTGINLLAPATHGEDPARSLQTDVTTATVDAAAVPAAGTGPGPVDPSPQLVSAGGIGVPATLALDDFGRGRLTLTAGSGATLRWRITAPGLSVTPSSGTLKPGQTGVISVRALRVRYWCGVPAPVTAPLELHGPKGTATTTVRWRTC
ncbi:hypothetical protein GCM10009530_34140 [Microbispora corallina]|uniref:Uncharacterized protein n=1 Tax=Microbispora corallina TaxID=83302 RepID=A0ABQ4G1R7_9ACTN|nr:hypothetical protein [Microbispora corallina]GIH41011.1 hypothetical protein Mco01_40110 [Microbispora corallina]